MQQIPYISTITIQHLSKGILMYINQGLILQSTTLECLDSSGMKTHRRGAWVVLRFHLLQHRRDFKKAFLFVDLKPKKILHCLVTNERATDAKQLKKLLIGCRWTRVDIILADGGYDTRNCFNAIADIEATPDIPVRRNAITRNLGCPSRT
jgi:hypothetical protein